MAQRRHDEGKRPRISVSLNPEDYDWIEQLESPAASLSYKLSRLVTAARLAGLALDEAKSGGVLEDFSEWLGRRRKNKLAADLHDLLTQYLRE